MGSVFSFVYSRSFRTFLITTEAAAVLLAILFVVHSGLGAPWKALLFASIIIPLWEVGLSLSLKVVTEDYIDRIIDVVMYTTRRSALRPYVFVVNVFVYLLVVLYITSLNNIVLTSVGSLLIIILIGDKMNSLYMSFIIAQIADGEESEKKHKKDPKNPLQK